MVTEMRSTRVTEGESRPRCRTSSSTPRCLVPTPPALRGGPRHVHPEGPGRVCARAAHKGQHQRHRSSPPEVLLAKRRGVATAGSGDKPQRKRTKNQPTPPQLADLGSAPCEAPRKGSPRAGPGGPSCRARGSRRSVPFYSPAGSRSAADARIPHRQPTRPRKNHGRAPRPQPCAQGSPHDSPQEGGVVAAAVGRAAKA